MNEKTAGYIERAKAIFGDAYDFSLVTDVKNAREKVKIRCKKHDFVFEAPFYHLLEGHGCKECKKETLRNLKAFTDSEFQKKLDDKFGPIYKVITPYVNNHTKVTCFCSKCGQYFTRRPATLFFGKGCTNCLSSKLEQSVMNALQHNNILFEREKMFPWLGSQRLDFYLPEYNIAIECQGEIHFIPKKLFGGEEGLKEIQKLDYKKYILCKEHNIHIMYVSEKVHTYHEPLITSFEELINKILSNSKIEIK